MEAWTGKTVETEACCGGNRVSPHRDMDPAPVLSPVACWLQAWLPALPLLVNSEQRRPVFFQNTVRDLSAAREIDLKLNQKLGGEVDFYFWLFRQYGVLGGKVHHQSGFSRKCWGLLPAFWRQNVGNNFWGGGVGWGVAATRVSLTFYGNRNFPGIYCPLLTRLDTALLFPELQRTENELIQ